MLWYKGWLETRARLAFSLGVVIFILAFVYWASTRTPAPGEQPPTGGGPLAVMCAPWIAAMLAGTGIITQPTFQATKGLHGSTYFTLSLPVSRLRLLSVRASLGWLELTALVTILCCGLWAVSPTLQTAVTGIQMVEYAAALIAYSSAFYSLSVLLGTFLDDLWRMWASVCVWAAFWAVSTRLPLPHAVNIFRAVGEGSPLLLHLMPWAAICTAAAMTVILFFAASKVVRVRQY